MMLNRMRMRNRLEWAETRDKLRSRHTTSWATHCHESQKWHEPSSGEHVKFTYCQAECYFQIVFYCKLVYKIEHISYIISLVKHKLFVP